MVIMKLLILTNGLQLQGELVEEDEETMTLRLDYGTVIIEKTHIESSVDYFDCTQEQLGQFIETPRGVYLKVGQDAFVLVSNEPMSPTHVQRISDGVNVSFEEVFPEYEAGK